MSGVSPGCVASFAFGVAHRLAADGRSSPPFVCPVLGPWSSRLQGVGQNRTASRSGGNSRSLPGFAPDLASVAVGVGQNRSRSCGDLLCEPACESDAIGVGNLAAARSRRSGPCTRSAPTPLSRIALAGLPVSWSLAFGVGQRSRAAIIASPGLTAAFGEAERFDLVSLSLAVGVGKDEQPLAEVRRADLGGREHVPFRIVPERGQRPENSSEVSKQLWHVLHDDEAGSKYANDANELGPEAGAGAVDANSLAGD